VLPPFPFQVDVELQEFVTELVSRQPAVSRGLRLHGMVGKDEPLWALAGHKKKTAPGEYFTASGLRGIGLAMMSFFFAKEKKLRSNRQLDCAVHRTQIGRIFLPQIEPNLLAVHGWFVNLKIREFLKL
jgi:hypothetical protein